VEKLGQFLWTYTRTHRIFTLFPGSTVLRFTPTGTPPAVGRIRILPMNQHTWRPITFGMKLLQFTGHRRCWECCPSTRRYLLQLITSLKNTGITILLAFTAHQTPTFTGGSRTSWVLDVDSVNSSCDYFAYLCIPSSETTLHQKGMSIADRSHLWRQTAETNCKNEPC
jgi:hypothetical protein